MNTEHSASDKTTKPRNLLFTATLKALAEKYKKLLPLDQMWLIHEVGTILQANPPMWQRRGNFNSALARSILERKGLTQRALANQTGVALTNLCKYENRKATPRGNSPGSKKYLEWLAQNGYTT